MTLRPTWREEGIVITVMAFVLWLLNVPVGHAIVIAFLSKFVINAVRQGY